MSYTLFFRLERAHILQNECPAGTPMTDRIDKEVLDLIEQGVRPDPVEFPRPQRYANLVLSPYWFSSLHQKDYERTRKHVKRATLATPLADLSRIISARWKLVQKDPNDDVVAYCKRLHEHEKAIFEERLQKEQRGQLLAMQKALRDQEKKARLAISSVHQNLEKARLARNSTMQRNQGQHKSSSVFTAAMPSSSRGDLSSAPLPQATSVHPPLKAGREGVIMASLMSNSGMLPNTDVLGRMSGYDAAPVLNTIDLQQKRASLQSGPNISTISKELPLLSETSQAKIVTLPTDLASSSSLTSRLYTQLPPTFDNVKSLAKTAKESFASNSSPFEELTKEYSSVPVTRESSEISKADQDAVDALAALAGKRPATTSVMGDSTSDARDNKDVNSDKLSFLEKIRMAEVGKSEQGNKNAKKKIKEKFRPPSKEIEKSMKLSDDAVLRKAAWLTNGPPAKSTAAHVAVYAQKMYPHVVEGCIPPQSSLLHNIQPQMFAQSSFPSPVAEQPAPQIPSQPFPHQLSAAFQPSRPVKSSLSASMIERLALQINDQHKRTAADAFVQETNDIGTTYLPPPLKTMICLPGIPQRRNDIQQMTMLAETEELQRRIAVAELIARREEIAANSLSHHPAILGGDGVGSVPESGLATVSRRDAANISTANSRETTDDTRAALEFAARFSYEFQEYKKLRHF